MRQRWSDIVWCHWPVPVEAVASILPPGLTPETFDGSAWIGLIPFAMSDLRLPGPLAPLSRLLGVGSFGEVNVRTYVTGPDGRTGVWFCTLDADRFLAVATARVAFGLPYRRASTHLEKSSTELAWTSQRRGDGRRADQPLRQTLDHRTRLPRHQGPPVRQAQRPNVGDPGRAVRRQHVRGKGAWGLDQTAAADGPADARYWDHQVLSRLQNWRAPA